MNGLKRSNFPTSTKSNRFQPRDFIKKQHGPFRYVM